MCSMSDIIVRQTELKNLSLGDNIYFANAGAYSSTESKSLFLSRDLPRIYLHKDGIFSLLRDKTHTYNFNI